MRFRSLLVAALLSSCVSAATPPATPGASGAVRGGTAVVAWQEPTTLDMLRAPGIQAAATIARVAVEGLARLGPDGNEQPVLARTLPTVANGGVTVAADARSMSVRYLLRDGVHWSDGAPFTSADVRFTWQSIMTDPKVGSREGYDRIADVETPDDLTAIVRYAALDPAYLSRFDTILPKHLLDGASDAARETYGRMPVGTGPFTITEFAAGDHVTAERNPRYRVAGQPYLDRIVFRFTPSVDVAKAQLRAGEADLVPSIFEGDVPELERESGIAITSAPSPVVEAILFQLARPTDAGADPAHPHPVLSDIAVRRALVRATPKQRIVDTLLFGKARAGTSEVPTGWAAVNGLSQEAYDPDRAKRDLDVAGWIAGADGIRSRDGVRASLAITGTTGNAVRERIEQVLVDEWRAIGVALQITNISSNVLTASWSSNGVRKRGAFDMVIANAGLGTAGSDPVAYLAQRHACAGIPAATNGGAGANYERWCDARVDRALADAAATLDRDQQRTRLADVLRAENDQVVGIWLYDRGRLDARRTRLLGIASNGWDQVTWNAQEWSLAP